MKRILKSTAACLLAAVLALETGCGAVGRKGEEIVVCADSEFGGAAQNLSEAYAGKGAKVDFVFDTTEALTDRIENGERADLLVLYGVTPADKLRDRRVIDNYAVFAGAKTAKGTVALTMAKPLRSHSYAQAQKFADFIMSDEGQVILKKSGYSPR